MKFFTTQFTSSWHHLRHRSCWEQTSGVLPWLLTALVVLFWLQSTDIKYSGNFHITVSARTLPG